MPKLLSVIVPVYKVEPYIVKCLDSLLVHNEDGTLNEELMSLMDILIVNDGTPDRSAELSGEYAMRYPQYFRQIDKENGGHGSVWNLGVKEAQGKYLRFLDSDDWLENLDRFLEKLRETDSDLILTNTVDHCENNEIWIQQILDMEFYHSYDADRFDWLGNRTQNYLLHHCCTYKTEVFRQYLPGLFLEKQPYDDTVLWPAAMIGGKSIEAFDFPLYHYLMDRPGQSMSPEVRNRNKAAMLKSDKHVIEFYEKHPVCDSSTKAQYIVRKLPKLYASKYREYVSLGYKDGKSLLKEWDRWAREINPNRTNVFVKAYRMLPYFIYRPICLAGLWILSKRKRKESDEATYVRG